MAYFNQSRFSGKWGLWADVHLRTREDIFSGFSQSILRGGLTYYLNDLTKITAGYAYVSHYPADQHANITRPEHRPWQQLQWHTNYSRIRVMQYLRLEERFRQKVKNEDELDNGYNFNYRVRYNLLLTAALGKKAFAPNTLSFVLNDELHVNFGEEIIYNYFDQNRFFVGFSYHTTGSDNLQFGYLNVFQQLPSGNQYRQIQGIRMSYIQNLDFRRK